VRVSTLEETKEEIEKGSLGNHRSGASNRTGGVLVEREA
jgi:hypothetical protein